MLKRLLLASVLFLILFGLLMLPSLLSVYRGMSQGATGIDLVAGSAGENIFRIGGLVVAVALACWLSGKLIRH
jgi:hypothetical protein